MLYSEIYSCNIFRTKYDEMGAEDLGVEGQKPSLRDKR